MSSVGRGPGEARQSVPRTTITTARPLVLAVAAVCTSFIFSLWLSQHRLNNVEANVYEVAANAEPSVVYLEDARTELDRMGLHVADCVAAAADRLPTALASRTRFEEARTHLYEALQAYERLPFFPGEESLYRDARRDLGPVEQDMNVIIVDARDGRLDSATVALVNNVQPKIEALSSKLKAIVEYDTAHATKVLEGIAASRRRSWEAAIAGTTFSLVLSVVATTTAAYALWKAATSRQRVDEERGARLAAEQQTRLRDQFLVLVSHELRSPLSALQLAVEALSRKPERPSELLQSTAVQQVARMTALVEELMLAAHLHLGAISTRPTQVDLLALVRERIENWAPSIAQSGSTVHLAGETPVIGLWDSSSLGRVIDKLLSNAIRFGAGRPIDITVSQHDARARLIVTDHGIGISPDLLPAVFERFQRGVSERNYPGLGLGLYVARGLVEAMGGTIVAASSPSEGTTFTVDLPLGNEAGPQ
jgi:signal transduction histidine kinase